MIIRDLLPKSVYVTIDTVKDHTSVENIYSNIQYNLDFLQSFKAVFLCYNVTEDCLLSVHEEYIKIWRENLPSVVTLFVPRNLGHMRGTIDLEENVFDLIKKSKEVKYIFKSMADMLTSAELLDRQLPDSKADLFYLPSFSYETLMTKGAEHIISNSVLPQTTFFIANISDIDSLYGNDVDQKWNMYEELKQKHSWMKPWDIPSEVKFDCETHLFRTFKDKKRVSLLTPTEKTKLINLVSQNKIGDPSHKNIMFSSLGICHFQYPDKPVHIINN